MSISISLKKMIGDSFKDNKIMALSICILLAGYWFQDVIFSRNFGTVLTDIPKFVDNLTLTNVFEIIFPYVVAQFLFYLDDVIQAKRFPKMELSIVNNLINQVFESIKTTKKSVNVNELIINLKNVLDIKNIYILITTYIVPALLIGGALLFYFLMADIKYGLIAIVMLVFFILLTTYLENECIEIAKIHEESVNKLYDEIQDIMSNNDTILAFNTQNKEMNHMENVKENCSNKHIYSELKSGEVTFKLSTSSMIMMLALDALAIKMYIEKIITPDLLISLCLLSYTFIQYYNSAIFKLRGVMNYLGKYNELDKYFSEFLIKEGSNNQCTNIFKGNIVFKDVQVLHDNKPYKTKFNFEIRSHAKTCITGPIGTGKTSILKMLSGIDDYIGQITIGEHNIKDCSHESLTNNIIYIQQHPKMFNRSIYENLFYGTNYHEGDVQNIVTKYKIDKFLSKFPKGLMTNVGKEGSHLSGGQKQIIALLRAIIQQKEIILLDEPTSSLDQDTKKIFLDLLDDIKNKTIIVVTHDKSIYSLFDDMIEL